MGKSIPPVSSVSPIFKLSNSTFNQMLESFMTSVLPILKDILIAAAVAVITFAVTNIQSFIQPA